MAATMLDGAARRGKRAWFVVHRKELIDQTGKTFRDVGIRHGFIAQDMPIDPTAPVQLCGIHTLGNRLTKVEAPDVIVWDEAHHAIAASWARVMNVFPNAVHIGLSATPQRLDGRGLGEHFDELICGPSVSMLIERGFLSPYRYFAPGRPDLSGVRMVGGDYNRGELGAAMDKAALVGDVVEHYQRLAAGQQGIVFAVSVEHSKHIAAAFIAAGVAAAHVDGSMKPNERKAIVEGFRAGHVRVMTNVDLFGEGFDVPGLVYCGLARPTKSLALHLQQVGRALRVMAGKREAIICDHAGNAFLHGLPDEERKWSLVGRKKGAGSGAGGDAFPIRQCLDCYQISRSNVSVCPCGSAFPVRDRAPEKIDDDLYELKRGELAAADAAKEARKAEERACATLADWEALARARGYKPGWAKYQWEFRQKFKRRAA